MDSDLAAGFASFTTGVYVLTVNDGGQHHGMSSSWVTQVSAEPPLFIAAIDKRHHSCGAVAKTRAFGLNVLGVGAKPLEDYFLSAQARRLDNLAGIDYELSARLSVPWLRLAAISIEARVTASFEAGDHMTFVAQPLGVRINNRDRPLTSQDLDYVYLGGSQVIARDRTGWS